MFSQHIRKLLLTGKRPSSVSGIERCRRSALSAMVRQVLFFERNAVAPSGD